jgi:hypothetical protein
MCHRAKATVLMRSFAKFKLPKLPSPHYPEP